MNMSMAPQMSYMQPPHVSMSISQPQQNPNDVRSQQINPEALAQALSQVQQQSNGQVNDQN
jgi:hypothetical protein